MCVCAAFTAAAQNGAPAPELYQSLPFRFVGPTGNRIVAVAGVAGDPSVIYAGAASGGLFKTTDAGLHWQPLFDAMHVASIGAIAVAPANPDVVWVGTGEAFIRGNVSIGNGVYRSTDAGKSWTHVGLENTGRIARVVVDPADPRVAYVAALGHCYGPQPERGVFRTTDGGTTWERVLFVDENTGAVDLVIDPSNPKTLFAAMWQFTIYPWYAVSGGAGSGLHVSRDGGTTWTRLSGNGLPSPPLGRIGLGIAPSNPKRIYATIETADQGNLWRSDDGGAHWTIISRDRAINNRARYFSRLGITPDNPEEVYFLTQRLMHSTDGGVTIRAVPEVYPDQHDIWIDPQDANRQIVANDRYVNISRNRGRSWFRAGLPNAQMYRVSTDRQVPYNIFGARQDGPSYRGPSNSLLATGQIPADLWEYAGWNESGYVIPDRDEEHILWVSDNRHVERYNTRVRSTRDVNPWIAKGSGNEAGRGAEAAGGRGGNRAARRFRMNWTAPLALAPHDPDTAYAGSQYVHRTTDDGRTWTIISPDLTTNDRSKLDPLPGLGPDGQDMYSVLFAIAESPVTPGIIWAGSNDGQVQLTRDAGKTWMNVTAHLPGLPPAGTISSIEPSRYAEGTAYLSVDRHRANDPNPYIFKTADYGKTWKLVVSGIPKSVFSYVRVVREDPKRAGLLYAGTENSLYVTLDDGASWLPFRNNLPPVAISWMVVQEDFNDLVLSTYGRGFWIFDDLSPLQQLTPAVLRSPSFLFQPRPAYIFRPGDPLVGNNMAVEFDPASDVGANPPPGAAINYFLSAPASAAVEIVIVDPHGTAIRKLPGPNARGINRVWWDLRTTESAASNRGMGFGAPGRDHPYVAPGVYTVKLFVDGREHATTLTLRKDPNSDWQ